MPKSSDEYPFEHRVAFGIGERVERLMKLAGQGAGYLLVLKGDGRIDLSIHPMGRLPQQPGPPDGESFVQLTPLDDGMEYCHLEWSAITRETMEKLIGGSFEPSDFVSRRSGDAVDFPESWNVMF